MVDVLKTFSYSLKIVSFSFIIATSALAAGCAPKATVFPAPQGVAASDFYELKADGQPTFAYATFRRDKFGEQTIAGAKVSPLTFCIFDFSKDAKLEIKLKKGVITDPQKAVIRPLSKNIKPQIDTSNKDFDIVKIALKTPSNYTFDPRGDGYCALHIFTNTPETSRPDKNDGKVKYFGAGVHKIESLKIGSDETLYLEGGAVLLCSPTKVRGKMKRESVMLDNMQPPINVEDAENVKICGRGIISCANSLQEGKRMTPFTFRSLKNLSIKDIVVIEASEWNIAMYDVKDSNIDNLKIISYYVNSDGICPSSNCDNIKIKNCFVHNADDSLEIKAMDSFWGSIPKGCQRYFGPVRNITFEDCIVWNDLATPMGVTHEIGNPIENIVFRNITVIHHTSIHGPYPVRAHIALFPAGGGKVSNMLFENITLESTISTYKNCININNFHGDSWRKNTPRYDSRPFSTVENITFRNINFNANTDKIGIYNSGSDDEIRDIKFENIVVNGKKIDTSHVDAKNAKFSIK